jgi:hypothetical protein
MKASTFRIYGVVILLVLFYVQYTGWSLTDVDEVHKVPRSVRNNPGVYRTHYHSHYIRIGGK